MNTRIETPRLTLRPWDKGDAEQLTLGLNDYELAKWLAFVPHPYTPSHAENWIRNCHALSHGSERPAAYEFAIERRGDPRAIGGVSLNKIDDEARTGGGGLWIARPYQGQGYGREAFAAKIRFAFFELGLTTLINGYLDGNEASWAMQRKLGYRSAGNVPRTCMADGR